MTLGTSRSSFRFRHLHRHSVEWRHHFRRSDPYAAHVPFAGRTRVAFRLFAVMAVLLLAGCAGGERPELIAGASVPDADPTPLPTTIPTPTPFEQPTAEPVATAAPAPPADPIDCLNQRQRVGQLIWPLATEAELPNARRLAVISEIGGIGLLGIPDLTIKDAIADLQAAGPLELLIASDEEGGLVQRLAGVLDVLPSAAQLAANRTPGEVRTLMTDYANGMTELGITVAFAPVVDIGGGPGIGSRAFGDDPAVVTEYAAAVAEGLRAGGVTPVFKHFPGHGSASADSHISLPVTPPLSELRQKDLLPYETLLPTAEAVMVGHLSVPGLSDETPTSLSPNTIGQLLRGEFAYRGLVISDAMNMGAITNNWTVPQAAELSISAGTDVVLLGKIDEVEPVVDHLVAAIEAGALNPNRVDEAARRVLALKDTTSLCVGAQ